MNKRKKNAFKKTVIMDWWRTNGGYGFPHGDKLADEMDMNTKGKQK